MGISTIQPGATFITEQQSLNRRPGIETAGSLGFSAETAGPLANNVGGSFCAMA